ncbi:cation:proton antiporter [Nocardioides yefusunii]|uniref:Cation:proton antiporter n=1 Tax=Nocardioides yefusunii TaxID=2500546 RepID=A0ABW1QYJ6_9ACTN|nr:sodium:proton antiporter [Nocardioides yefusunii]
MHHELLLIVGGGLAVIITAAVLARRTGVAAPLLLLALGVGAAYLPNVPEIEVEPELILAGVLPPLLYASAVRMPILDFRRNAGLITWLSVGLVIVSALVVGFVVHAVFPDIPLALGIALGAVLSPTDAVAATAIGKRLGLPPRLMTVLEGESLVNDASALVLLRASLAAVSVGSFSLFSTTVSFLWAVVGAVLVGLLVGWATAALRTKLDDPVLNTTISFAVPFLAFFPAEEIGSSGVLAVVVAGLVTGHLGMKNFSAHDRHSESTNWATVNFVLESAVFLLMGLELPALIDDASGAEGWSDLWTLVALLVGMLVVLRFVGVGVPLWVVSRRSEERRERTEQWVDAVGDRIEGWDPQTQTQEIRLGRIQKRLAKTSANVAFQRREPITKKGGVVIAWAGMRGVVTLAAAQSIPADVEHRSFLVLAAFVVAVITLVGFGGTLPALIRRTGLSAKPSKARNAEVVALMSQLGDRTYEQLGPLESAKVDGVPLEPEMVEMLNGRFLPLLQGAQADIKHRKPGVWGRAVIVQRRYLAAMQEALWEERSIGAFSSGTYAAAQAVLDREERRLNPLD